MGIWVARKALYPGALCEFTPFSNTSVSNLLLQMTPLTACCFCQYWPGSSWHALSFSHSLSLFSGVGWSTFVGGGRRAEPQAGWHGEGRASTSEPSACATRTEGLHIRMGVLWPGTMACDPPTVDRPNMLWPMQHDAWPCGFQTMHEHRCIGVLLILGHALMQAYWNASSLTYAGLGTHAAARPGLIHDHTAGT